MALGIAGLPASHLMAFMYDNIQIISTGLYGASEFLKWSYTNPFPISINIPISNAHNHAHLSNP
nr:MAG TPA: hypothetical protein [Caudoviricetes sp.]